MRQVLSTNLCRANQTDKVVEIGLDMDSTVAMSVWETGRC